MSRSDRLDLLHRLVRRGAVYRARTTPERAAEAIEQALGEIGFRCRRIETEEGLRVECTKRSPPLQRLRYALPLHATWRIRETPHGEVTIHRRFLIARWYGLVILLLVAAIAAALRLTFWTGDRDWSQETVWISFAITAVAGVVVLASFLVAFLFRAFEGGVQGDALWRAIRRHVEASGGRITPTETGLDTRGIMVLLLLLTALAAFAVWGLPSMLDGSSDDPPVPIRVLLISLVLSALSVLVLSFLLVVIRGMTARLVPALSGLCVMLSVLMFTGATVPWIMSDGVFSAIMQSGLVLRAAPSGDVVESPRRVEELKHRVLKMLYRRTSQYVWVSLFFTLLIVLLASGFAIAAVRVADRSRPTVDRLRHRRAGDLEEQAVSSRRLVRQLRLVFFAIWAGLGVSVVTGLGVALTAAACGSSLLPCPGGFEGVALSIEVLPTAFGRRIGDPTVGWLVRLAWSIYGLVVVAPFLLSAGHLALSRRRLHRELRSSTPAGRVVGIDRVARELVPDEIPWTVRTVIIPGEHLHAESHAFGLTRPERYILLSEGISKELTRRELRAVVAHELAHHLLGHCRSDLRMQWLGRITLTGDGLGRVLQHSFGYELHADGAAHRRLGVPLKDLEGSLRKIRRLKEDRQVRELVRIGRGPQAITAATEPEREESAAPESLLDRCRLVIDLFIGRDLSDAYWHPMIEERLAALSKLGGIER